MMRDFIAVFFRFCRCLLVIMAILSDTAFAASNISISGELLAEPCTITDLQGSSTIAVVFDEQIGITNLLQGDNAEYRRQIRYRINCGEYARINGLQITLKDLGGSSVGSKQSILGTTAPGLGLELKDGSGNFFYLGKSYKVSDHQNPPDIFITPVATAKSLQAGHFSGTASLEVSYD